LPRKPINETLGGANGDESMGCSHPDMAQNLGGAIDIEVDITWGDVGPQQ